MSPTVERLGSITVPPDTTREPMRAYKVRLPAELQERAEREATRQGMRWAEYLRIALIDRLDRDEDRRRLRHDTK